MCGLVAIASLNAPVSRTCLERGMKSLDHRGPDDRGSWFSNDRKVALGHTRLSIIDLVTGRQPIASETGQLQLMVNGEFYDFERQRAALEKRGHRFRTRSDSEIALHLFEEHGPGAVHHLRGEFAIVLWDERTRILHAFRDRYGVKPLYYSVHDQTLYLASEIKALVACGVPAAWDLESIYLGNGLRGASRTPFKGVFALPPGHALRFGERGLEIQEYWDIEYPRLNAEGDSIPDEEVIRVFRNELEEAVRLRLRADVPVACYLSGGLDSSAVLGLASRFSPDPVRTFTLRFPDEEYDESQIASQTAVFNQAEHHEHLVDERSLADCFSDYVYHAETHATNAHGIAKYQLSRVVRDAGYKVVLTGEGADEVLFGYAPFRQDLWDHAHDGISEAEKHRLVAQLHRDNAVSTGLLLSDRPPVKSSLLMDILGFTPAWMQVHLSRLQTKDLPLNYELFADYDEIDPARLILQGIDIEKTLAGRGAVAQSAYLWAKSMLPNYILAVLGDRSEMAHSVEGRVPFLDHKVGEFLHTVPVNLKIRGQVEKYLLREAVRDVVTETVYRRQKHPFLSPPVDLLNRNGFSEFAQDTFRSQAARSMPLLDQTFLSDAAEGLSGSPAHQSRDFEQAVLFALSLIWMHQRFGFSSDVTFSG